MKQIAIISGKGGVGKSSVSASLAVLLAKKNKIVAVDGDVDASNLPLLLGLKESRKPEEIATNYKARVLPAAKDCGKIVEACAFSAISWDAGKQMPKINAYLCEGCGTCKLICPKGIILEKVVNAVIREGITNYGFPLVAGQLKMGQSGSGKVVAEVKRRAEQKEAEIMLIDAAAGIGCPVIASVQGVDYVIAVTEPTPAALNDLKRGLKIVEHFDIPYGLVINKYDLNIEFSKKIEKMAGQQKMEILGKLPYDRKFVEAMVNLKPVVVYEEGYRKIFEKIWHRIAPAI